MRRPLLKYGMGALLAGGIIAGAATMAFADTTYGFQFSLPGYGGVACTSTLATAGSNAPKIYVNFQGSSMSPDYANFTGANSNCEMNADATWKTLYTPGQTGLASKGYVQAGTVPNESVRLMGGSGTLQGSQTIYGQWTP